jgi:hypothetical protein
MSRFSVVRASAAREGVAMKSQWMIAAALVALAVGSAQAAVTITTDAGTNVGGGLTKYTLTAHSNDATFGINAFEVTITGNLSQVHPSSLATPFEDFNAFMADSNVDSQFLFNSANVTALPGTSVDTASTLASTFTTGATAYADVPFVQVVVPTGESFGYVASIAINDQVGTATDLQGSVPAPVPEPASLGLLGLGAVALLRRKW